MLIQTLRRKAGTPVIAAALLLAAGVVPTTTQAGPIDPGFDLFSTPVGGAFVELPGGLMVDLQGNPIGPGDTDTIVQRFGGLPAGGGGTIGTRRARPARTRGPTAASTGVRGDRVARATVLAAVCIALDRQSQDQAGAREAG